MVLVASQKSSRSAQPVPPTPITETRLIYTSGVYVLSDAMRACRLITIYSDLLRFPKFTVYANEKSNPPYYFLGYYTVWQGDYVESRRALEFTEQAVFSYDNPVLQLSNLVVASATNVTNVIQAFAAQSTPPVAIVFIEQPPFSVEGCPYTRLKFKMPEGTRIQITAVGIPLEAYEGSQSASPVIRDVTDDVPRYPLDRDRSEDPARSPGYTDDLPGDTAIATSDDPDLGYVPPPSPLKPCWYVVGYGATSDNTSGSHLVSNGTGYPSWVRGNVLSVETRLIVDGYYNGCYGDYLIVDGVTMYSFSAAYAITSDDDNPNCPTS